VTEYIVPIIRWVICSLWRFIRRAKIGSERDTSVKSNRWIAQIWPFMPIYVKGKLILISENKFVFDLSLWGKIIACYVPNCTVWFRSLLQCTNFVKQNKHSKLFIFSSYQIIIGIIMRSSIFSKKLQLSLYLVKITSLFASEWKGETSDSKVL